MIWNFRLTVLLLLTGFASAPAQSVIKVLHFDKKAGIIDKGEDAGLHVGDVFDVNRYAGDFVYWIGRVEVVVVKPKAAGIKMLTQAENAQIQQGDVLELRRRDSNPVLEKKTQQAQNSKKNDSLQQGKSEPAGLIGAEAASLRDKKVIFGLTSGFLHPLKNSSQSLGMNFSLLITPSRRVINMTHAYTTSVGLQAFCRLPLSNRLSVNLNYDYIPLNVRGAVEANLLNYGLKASASMMKISAAVESHIYQRFYLGLGAGLFLPQVTVKGGSSSMTISDRHLGFASSAAHLLPLGPAAWLRSMLEYDIFLDNGPAIHYLTLQTGLSIGIGKH